MIIRNHHPEYTLNLSFAFLLSELLNTRDVSGSEGTLNAMHGTGVLTYMSLIFYGFDVR